LVPGPVDPVGVVADPPMSRCGGGLAPPNATNQSLLFQQQPSPCVGQMSANLPSSFLLASFLALLLFAVMGGNWFSCCTARRSRHPDGQAAVSTAKHPPDAIKRPRFDERHRGQGEETDDANQSRASSFFSTVQQDDGVLDKMFDKIHGTLPLPRLSCTSPLVRC
jgi:hypothetical protein